MKGDLDRSEEIRGAHEAGQMATECQSGVKDNTLSHRKISVAATEGGLCLTRETADPFARFAQATERIKMQADITMSCRIDRRFKLPHQGVRPRC